MSRSRKRKTPWTHSRPAKSLRTSPSANSLLNLLSSTPTALPMSRIRVCSIRLVIPDMREPDIKARTTSRVSSASRSPKYGISSV
jgi:hypothetical protein